MSEKRKFQNSTIILAGIIVLLSGIFFGMYEYFEEKKNNAFSEMNLLLYETEIPQNIEIENEKNPDSNDNNEITEPNDDNEKDDSKNNQSQGSEYNYSGILEIPKINVKRGFLNIGSIYNNVDYNVTVIKGSTFPDKENNNLILASHSGDCNVCYFHNLYKLTKGDIAYIYYKNIKYTYKIVNIYDVKKDGTVTIKRDRTKNCLTLITCTRNSNTKQTVYILELISKTDY